MRKFFAHTLAVVMIVVSGVVAAQAPAQAWAYPNCLAGRVCTYINADGYGNKYDYTFTYVGACVNIGGIYNNAISSIWNNGTKHSVRFYLNTGCWGDNWLYPNNTQRDVYSSHNDQYSSFEWI